MLHPLSKLSGCGTENKEYSNFPNLKNISIDYADDLLMAVDELIHPGADIEATKEWKTSRLAICAVAQITERLQALDAPDLVSVSLSALQAFYDSLDQ